MPQPKPRPRQEADRPSENVHLPGRTRSLSEVLRTKRAPTADEAATIAEVHLLVAEWSAGKLPTEVVGGLCTGKQRWLATRFTPPDHPLFGPLMALMDDLIVKDGRTVPTAQGLFQLAEVQAAEAKVERDGGEELIVFPVRYRWVKKPDPSRGEPGVRGEAVYRPKDKRGPDVGEFRAAMRPMAPLDEGSDEHDDTPWWDRD